MRGKMSHYFAGVVQYTLGHTFNSATSLFLLLVPIEKENRQTCWRRGLDSNSWLRFAKRSQLIGRQSAHFGYLC